MRPMATQLDALSVTTCTTFLLPTSSIAFFTWEYINSLVTIVPGAYAGMACKNIVPLQEETRMLYTFLLRMSDHQSHNIEHPYFSQVEHKDNISVSIAFFCLVNSFVRSIAPEGPSQGAPMRLTALIALFQAVVLAILNGKPHKINSLYISLVASSIACFCKEAFMLPLANTLDSRTLSINIGHALELALSLRGLFDMCVEGSSM
ncbi:hypothetical protein KP509_22G035900 [Ceratopteris richardii]|uniref:Uncharacterized protein n=1 Tax=Ceratopteris richardii TaxID=49495 RepID=A0A8T2S3Z4_CERRI|nr:hypothetical protein KP509_22G035900 [Ceratopteris richardii]